MNTYRQNKPRDLIGSILSHILTYQDTSIKKINRIESAKAAKLLCEYVITMFVPDSSDGIALVQGFQIINLKLTEAIMKPDQLYDFSDEIGFLRTINKFC